MAFSLNRFKSWMIGPDRVKMCGSFRPNGTSAVGYVKGKGFSVARTDVGQYTVTFNERPITLVGFSCAVRAAALTDAVIAAGSTYSASNKTIIIQTMTETAAVGGAADVKFQAFDFADNANNEVYFEATFINSSVG